MPTVAELKSRVCRAIDEHADEITGFAQALLDSPEPGYREVRTARFVTGKLAGLGVPCRDGLALTGVKGVVSGGEPGPTVAVMGELDSLIVPDHPHADPATGAAHACGHHAQLAMMLGVALGLTQSGALPALTGRVAFLAVPAEEYIELEYRDGLRRQGKLTYLGGKAEFIKLGEFADVDLAMLTHSSSNPETKKLATSGTSNGIVAKKVQYLGKSAHAGASPEKGINALNAAALALAAINAQRETFRDEDTVRVHPIITKGGEVVNAVPADVRLETYVRGKTIPAIADANMKVDRALRAGALAIGAKVRITTLPGYLPMLPYPEYQALYRANAVAMVGEGEVGHTAHIAASTDAGDLSHVMPVIHPMAGGATGTSHGRDFIIADYGLGVINPAQAMAMTVIDLLADGAVKAKEVLARTKPPMTKEAYLAYMDSLLKEEEYQG